MKKKKPKQKHIHHNKRKPDRRSTKKTQNEYECKIKNRFLTRQEFHSKRGGPGDKEGVQDGKEIGVAEGRRVLWECRNLNP